MNTRICLFRRARDHENSGKSVEETTQKVYEVAGTQMENSTKKFYSCSHVFSSIPLVPETVSITSIANLPTPDVPYDRPTPSGPGEPSHELLRMLSDLFIIIIIYDSIQTTFILRTGKKYPHPQCRCAVIMTSMSCKLILTVTSVVKYKCV